MPDACGREKGAVGRRSRFTSVRRLFIGLKTAVRGWELLQREKGAPGARHGRQRVLCNREWGSGVGEGEASCCTSLLARPPLSCFLWIAQVAKRHFSLPFQCRW